MSHAPIRAEYCRSPCGERGLKSVKPGSWIGNGASLPVRGAWIEIHDEQEALQVRGMSLPVRGAWIEILGISGSALRQESLPVRGAWIEILMLSALKPGKYVAPRAGSVD